jgi:hypothetical protein
MESGDDEINGSTPDLSFNSFVSDIVDDPDSKPLHSSSGQRYLLLFSDQ